MSLTPQVTVPVSSTVLWWLGEANLGALELDGAGNVLASIVRAEDILSVAFHLPQDVLDEVSAHFGTVRVARFVPLPTEEEQAQADRELDEAYPEHLLEDNP